MSITPGERIGEFIVESVIGEGGMATIGKGRHAQYGHRVAIKLLLPSFSQSKEVLTRFEREQRTLARLRSDHTVRFYGAGRHNGCPYMLLELLEGLDLAEVLKRKGRFEMREAVGFVLQVCHALAEAHAQGIVHRDLKPSNFFLVHRDDGSGCIKVLDFGISKQLSGRAGEASEPSLTQARTVVGSPWYMSPEQMLSSRDVDAATDTWSLGVTLYEMLTMSIPFAARTTDEVCQRILADEPTPLRQLRPDLPPAFAAVVMQCLRRKPRERWLSVADFAQNLAEFGPDHADKALERIYALLRPTTFDPGVRQAIPKKTIVVQGGDDDDAG
ncbi:MAG: serine/threonine-protein kinase, partial [Myxococcota bacterium]